MIDNFWKSDNALDESQGITYVLLSDKKEAIIGYYNNGSRNKIILFQRKFFQRVHIPQPIINLSSGDIACTDNKELTECITNKKDVTFYCNEKLFHEFTHISDAYNFLGMEYPDFLMSTYSEYNAVKVKKGKENE